MKYRQEIGWGFKTLLLVTKYGFVFFFFFTCTCERLLKGSAPHGILFILAFNVLFAPALTNTAHLTTLVLLLIFIF